MQDNGTRRLYRQIYLCAFEKITIIINEVEKIIVIIITKVLKH